MVSIFHCNSAQHKQKKTIQTTKNQLLTFLTNFILYKHFSYHISNFSKFQLLSTRYFLWMFTFLLIFLRFRCEKDIIFFDKAIFPAQLPRIKWTQHYEDNSWLKSFNRLIFRMVKLWSDFNFLLLFRSIWRRSILLFTFPTSFSAERYFRLFQ